MSVRPLLLALLGLVGSGLIASPLFGAPAGGSRTIVLTNKMWVCSGPVNLDSVTVTMNAAAVVSRFTRDAVHLQPGCTGRIGRLDVVTSIADGVKIAGGVHDLTIGGGKVSCIAKLPTLHQDGVQVMGGERITLKGMSIDCGRPDESLINSNFFISMGGVATTPPTDVVCDACSFGGGAAHTVSVQKSIRSGVQDSSLCRAKYPALTLTIGSLAVDPVNVDNTLKDCAGSGSVGSGGGVDVTAKLTLAAARTSAFVGKAVTLAGGFGKPKNGREVEIYARPFGATAFTIVRTLRTDPDGSWKLVVHPQIQTSYRAVSRSATSATVVVPVRPLPSLSGRGSTLRARVIGKTSSLGGRTVALQMWRGGRWTTVQRRKLDAIGRTTFAGIRRGSRVRITIGATPGYLGASSPGLTVRS
jgi:hypothetical protein